MKPEVTVYVRSMKVPVGEKLVEELYPIKRATRAYEYSRDTVFQVRRVKEYAYVLPDDQKDLVEFVERLSEERGFKLRIIDVTKETVLYRLWKRLGGIKGFPVVVTRRGARLEAPFSVDDLQRFISESA